MELRKGLVKFTQKKPPFIRGLFRLITHARMKSLITLGEITLQVYFFLFRRPDEEDMKIYLLIIIFRVFMPDLL